MEKLNYKDFNQILYKRRSVGYSFSSQSLSFLQSLIPKSFSSEIIKKSDWDKLEFIRDGSLMTLEDTLIVKKDLKFSAFITPHKALIYDKKLKVLGENYKRPLSLNHLVYLVFLVGILGVWWFI
ncbi:MAG: hypothetical protein GOU98_01905 [Candidatus Altiarchaeota archaeon]|nr:hypothetical protein [Candidatus Altiarchaeota archaeon]